MFAKPPGSLVERCGWKKLSRTEGPGSLVDGAPSSALLPVFRSLQTNARAESLVRCSVQIRRKVVVMYAENRENM